MDENEIGELTLGGALKVHRALGPGLLENAYEACLSYELTKAGLEHQRQFTMRSPMMALGSISAIASICS